MSLSFTIHSANTGNKISGVCGKAPDSRESRIVEIATNILSNPKGYQDVRTLLERCSISHPEQKAELTKRLVNLFLDVSDRKQRGRISGTCERIESKKLYDILGHSLPFFEHVSDGYQRAAILDAISKISSANRSAVLEAYCENFPAPESDGYHLASIIRVINALPRSQRASILRNAKPLLEKAQNGLHKAAIVRALHKASSSDVERSLCYSVGDPEVEELLRDWQKDVDLISPEESAQLQDIQNYVSQGEVPSNFAVSEVSEDVGSGLFAKSDIAKNTVIGIYTGILELVPSQDCTFSGYAYSLIADRGSRSVTVSPEEAHCMTRVATDDEGNLIHRSAIGEDFIIQVNAELMGNYTRCINYSPSSNVSAKLIQLADGRREVLITASKDIKAGDQLLLDYGVQYWQAIGIDPEAIESDTYRLENGHIVEKSKVTFERKVAVARPSKKTLFKSVELVKPERKKRSPVEVLSERPIKKSKIQPAKKKIVLVKPNPVKRQRLLVGKRNAFTDSYKEYLNSIRKK